MCYRSSFVTRQPRNVWSVKYERQRRNADIVALSTAVGIFYYLHYGVLWSSSHVRVLRGFAWKINHTRSVVGMETWQQRGGQEGILWAARPFTGRLRTHRFTTILRAPAACSPKWALLTLFMLYSGRRLPHVNHPANSRACVRVPTGRKPGHQTPQNVIYAPWMQIEGDC